LSRLRELSVQAASDTIGNRERGFLNKEYMALKDEIERITKSTEYNGTMLLVGDQSQVDENLRNRSNQYPLEIQVSKDYYQSVDSKENRNPVNIIRIDLEGINSNLGEAGLSLGTVDDEAGTRVDNKEDAQMSINKVDSAISKVAEYRAYLGSIQSRLGSTVRNLSIASENFSAANSRIRDTDFAEETARMTQSSIIKNAGVAILGQANQTPQAALRLLGG
jgi:flagellin